MKNLSYFVVTNETIAMLESGLYRAVPYNNTTLLAILDPLVDDDVQKRAPLYIVIPMTVTYVLIFISGIVGNVSTCIVISKNRYMHTATNYYLFSLAISDLLLLITGLPPEIYQIWFPRPYIFGEAFCIIRGFAAETSANATVLTITAFTVERYLAICHPLRSHTMSNLSRAIKFVVAIWILALFLAVPQAIQFGIKFDVDRRGRDIESSADCTVLQKPKLEVLNHAFEVSTFLFFVGPMILITVLYALIGLRLRHSRLLNKTSSISSDRHDDKKGYTRSSQRNVIKMLVAVVVAFFICWAPFHAQRLLAIYGKGDGAPSNFMLTMYNTLTYISGIFYYLSTTVNPVLYHIMSNKFREAFKHTVSQQCVCHRDQQKRTYSVLSAYARSNHNHHQQENTNNHHNSSHHRESSPFCEAAGSIVWPEHPFRGRLSSVSSAQSQPGSRAGTLRTVGNSRTMAGARNEQPKSEETFTVSAAKEDTKGELVKCKCKCRTCETCEGRLKKNSVGVLSKFKVLPRNHYLKPVRGLQPNVKKGTHPCHGCNGDCLETGDHVTRRDEAGRRGCAYKLASHISVDSAKSTNTISNSSLQDLDDTEFTGSELATYMGELNERSVR